VKQDHLEQADDQAAPEPKPASVDRPVLTLPEQESALVRAEYAKADTILEFGSGGSTVLAAEMPGKHVYSVESDRSWARMMKRWFAANPPADGSEVHIVWSDIGPTADWGHPADETAWSRFARYPLGIWQSKDFVHPDVVLVDGRFRVGCCLATAFSISRPVTLLFDDYTDRSRNRQVEEFLGEPQRMAGRMAQFHVEPTPIPAHRLLRIIRFMQRP
jgi:hypothetical protein